MEECGGATTCINPDTIDMWVTQSGCTNNCNQVSVLGRREEGRDTSNYRVGIFSRELVVVMVAVLLVETFSTLLPWSPLLGP